MSRPRAFTLVEVLVVIAVIAALTAVFMPALRVAHLQARVVVVNAELGNLALALENYAVDNSGKYPPTRVDCMVPEHIYALPRELVAGLYLPGEKKGAVIYADIEDKFNPGFTYKYIAPGLKFDFFGTPYENQPLYIPKGFPAPVDGELIAYDKPDDSPVTWVLFSVGPNFEKMEIGAGFDIEEGSPVVKKFWYSPEKGMGLVTRMRLSNGNQIGTFNTKVK